MACAANDSRPAPAGQQDRGRDLHPLPTDSALVGDEVRVWARTTQRIGDLVKPVTLPVSDRKRSVIAATLRDRAEGWDYQPQHRSTGPEESVPRYGLCRTP